jgi:hypothetical protein
MKQRFILFRRGEMYYCEDTSTRKQASLQKKNQLEALTLLSAKNEVYRQPVLNLQIARAYLGAVDPLVNTRTWQLRWTKSPSPKPVSLWSVAGDAGRSIRQHSQCSSFRNNFRAFLESSRDE